MFLMALIMRQLTIRQILNVQAERLAHFYAASLVIPPVISIWLVSAALLPRLWMSAEAFAAEHAAPLHEIHLLGALTLGIEPDLAYSIAMFLIVISAFVVWSNIRGSWRVGRVIKRLDTNANAPPIDQVALVNEIASRSGLSVGLVMTDYPLSFVWGFRRSKLVLSSGLLRTLTSVELAGVLEHESAHHARRDNMVKLVLSLCSYSSLAFPLSRLIVGWRATEVEMICDEVAAVRTSKPLEIAEALVKLRRHTLRTPIDSEPVATHAVASSFVSNSDRTFQRRVDRLLTLFDVPLVQFGDETRSHVFRASLLLLLSGISAQTIVLLFAPLSVHHTTETLIAIFK